MKNSRLTAALLVATIMVSYAPVQAEEPKGRLRAVKKTLDDSLDRFKRCMRGKCTQKEKIKVARDVGIAALAVIVVVGVAYLGKSVYQQRELTLPAHMRPELQAWAQNAWKDFTYEQKRQLAVHFRTFPLDSKVQLSENEAKELGAKFRQGTIGGYNIADDSQLWLDVATDGGRYRVLASEVERVRD